MVMDSTRTLQTIASFTLALLPACVIDTKLIDNDPSTGDADTSTTAATDDGPTSAPENDATSTTADPPATSTSEGDDTSTTPDECTLLGWLYMGFAVTDLDEVGSEPIDETCTVISAAPAGAGFELHLDCPQHAVMHGDFLLVIDNGPIPVLAPQPGDQLEVYFQQRVYDDINMLRPELVSLRSGGELLYASASGFFVDPNDAALAAAGVAPLTVDLEPGPCPMADNPFASKESGDKPICQREAPALLHITSPDDDDLLLAESTEDQISVGPRGYTIEARWARRGEDCGGVDLGKFAYAIALTTAP